MDIEKLKKWMESDDAKEYFAAEAERHELRRKRHERFEEWLKDNDFDKLMYRLILEHDDDYIDKCYHNGFMPYANRKLSFVIGYVVDNHEPIQVSELDCDFPNQVWQFRGYYFQHIHGQGTITRIYNKEDNKLLLQI